MQFDEISKSVLIFKYDDIQQNPTFKNLLG